MSQPAQTDWQPLRNDELDAYHQQGYLHLKGVFSTDEVARGIALIDDVLSQGAHTITKHGSFTDRHHTTRVRNAVSQHSDLDYFLDHPKMIGPLVSLLSESVQILGTEIFVRSTLAAALEEWHTDGGEYLQRIRLAPRSQDIQIKAQVFLTDTTAADSGNFMLIPGSHQKTPKETIATCYIDELNEPLRRGELPPDAVTVQAAPGDVLFFPYSLWHAVAPNRTQPRKTFIFRYGQLWHRPHDYLTQPADILKRMSPRLRRMFGDFGDDPHPTDFYKPENQREVMASGGHGAALAKSAKITL